MHDKLSIHQTPTNALSIIALKNHPQLARLRSPDVREARREAKAPPTTRPLNQNVDPTQLETTTSLSNEVASIVNKQYHFRVDAETDLLVVQITDEKGEMIRQIPPEAFLELASQMDKLIGNFLDELA